MPSTLTPCTRSPMATASLTSSALPSVALWASGPRTSRETSTGSCVGNSISRSNLWSKNSQINETVNVLLPHELWAFVWLEQLHTARERFCGEPGALATFWAKTKDNDEEWLQAHPCKSMIDSDPLRCVPIRLWGDDAPIGKHGRELRCMSWTSAVCSLESLASKIAI